MNMKAMLELPDQENEAVYVDVFEIALIQGHVFGQPNTGNGSLITLTSGVPVLVRQMPKQVVERMAELAAQIGGIGTARH